MITRYFERYLTISWGKPVLTIYNKFIKGEKTSVKKRLPKQENFGSIKNETIPKDNSPPSLVIP